MTNVNISRRNITRRVTWYLFFATITIFSLTEILIIELSYQSLRGSLDNDLITRGKALASITEAWPDGKIDFDFADEIMPDYSGSDPSAYFIIFRDDNSEVERSHSMGLIDLEISDKIMQRSFDKTYFWNEETDQGTIRFLAFHEIVRWEDELEDADWVSNNIDNLKVTTDTFGHGLSQKPSVKCLIIVGVNTREIQTKLQNILKLTSISLMLGLLLLLILSRWIVKQNLKCLHAFNESVNSISPSNLSPVPIPPVDEISPIAQTLNSVLIELQNAFKRERQFTSHVAHELRTPISEIRSLAEVAVKWPDKLDEESLNFFGNILDTVIHMQYMVENLLILSQSDSGQLKLVPSNLDMVDLVKESLNRWEKAASEKCIAISSDIVEDIIVHSDSHLIRMILDNLLMNAVEYSKPDSMIKVNLDNKNGRFKVQVSNQTNDLTKTDLPNLFNRFWQKNSVRSSNKSNCGLGLSIIANLSQLLGFDIKVELTDDSIFSISISGMTE